MVSIILLSIQMELPVVFRDSQVDTTATDWSQYQDALILVLDTRMDMVDPRLNHVVIFLSLLWSDEQIGFGQALEQEQIDIRLDSKIFVIDKTDNVFVLREVYKTSPRMPMVKNTILTLDDEADQVITPIWQRRNNLQGIAIRVASQESPPFIYHDGNQLYGIMYDIFKAMMLELNFTATFVENTDQAFGQKDPDTGQWNGLIGMLTRSTIDLALTDLSITKDRDDVVDFTLGIAQG